MISADIHPDEMWEDKYGAWWCEVDGWVYRCGQRDRTEWEIKRKYQGLNDVETEFGELWQVPDFIDVGIGRTESIEMTTKPPLPAAPADNMMRSDARRRVVIPPELRPRERQMLHFMSHGYKTVEIARALERAPDTIKSHINRLLEAMNARTREHAVTLGFYYGILTDDCCFEHARHMSRD